MADEAPKEIPSDEALLELSRKQLQSLAKSLGIRANTKSTVIIQEVISKRTEAAASDKQSTPPQEQDAICLETPEVPSSSSPIHQKQGGGLGQQRESNQVSTPDIIDLAGRRSRRKKDWKYVGEVRRWEVMVQSKYQAIRDRWKSVNAPNKRRKCREFRAPGLPVHEKHVPTVKHVPVDLEGKQKENHSNGNRNVLKRKRLGPAQARDVPLVQRELASKTRTSSMKAGNHPSKSRYVGRMGCMK